MNDQEIIEEWKVEHDTRLGMMCGAGKPTPEQEKLAIREANDHLKAIWRYEGEKRDQSGLD